VKFSKNGSEISFIQYSTTCSPVSSLKKTVRWGGDYTRLLYTLLASEFCRQLSRPALGPTQPPVQRVPGLSRG
jgi:hypothetical protein